MGIGKPYSQPGGCSLVSQQSLEISSWYPELFFYGDSAALSIQNILIQKSNDGYFDLSKAVAKGPSYLLYSNIDRASVDYTKGKWEVIAGRQRINWGLNLVWNPNDIFNAYSYFDYEERPGTDAVRVQYYLNSTSSAEIAYKPGRTSN